MTATADKQTIYDKLLAVQVALKAPKDQQGRFGAHRNAEGILAAVKPHLEKEGLTLLLKGRIEHVGGKNYQVATASVHDGKEAIEVEGWAWEGEISRGLDAPQVSGAANSYARKYALGGLFDIDDSRDDPDRHDKPAEEPQKPKIATGPQKFELQRLMKEKGIDTADQMTLFVESVINKSRVETEHEYQQIKAALAEEAE